MNCQAGDLALIKNVPLDAMGSEHNGKVIRCISLLMVSDIPFWKFEPELQPYEAVADKYLQPLRDQPGTDESLLWAPKPNKTIKIDKLNYSINNYE